MLALRSDTCGRLAAPRRPERVDSRVHDTLLSGCARLFLPSPSLREFQRPMQQRRGRGNLATLFGVPQVPSDTPLRALLDGVAPAWLRSLWPGRCEKIRRAGGATECTRTVPRGAHQGDASTLMLAGTAAFPSTAVPCPACWQRHEGGGQGSFRHTGGSATLVKAGAHRGFPLEGEAGRNRDGPAKQAGALQAATRLMHRLRQEPPQMARLVGGAARDCHAPCLGPLRQPHRPHGLGCKPDAPREVSPWGAALEPLAACETGPWHEGPAGRRRFFTSRIARAVPLTPSRRIGGTLVAVWEHDQSGKLRYHTAWCTDLAVDAPHGAVVVRIGRSRWKIANEQWNVQTTHGDALAPKDGQGHQTRARVLYLLTLLAFVAQVLLARGAQRSQRCLATTSRRARWHTFRTTMRRIVVSSWGQFLLISLAEEGSSP